MTQTGQTVSLKVAKNAVEYNGLAAIVTEPPPDPVQHRVPAYEVTKLPSQQQQDVDESDDDDDSIPETQTHILGGYYSPSYTCIESDNGV